LNFKGIDDFDYAGKTVLLRVDINSPIDRQTKKIVNENRIRKSIPTIRKILDKKAKLVIIAHQGDTLDYENLIPLAEHAEKISDLLGDPVTYVDDPCGPAAREAVRRLGEGEAVLLGNLRYLSEEVSTFENAVKLEPEEMGSTYLVRSLAPLCDYYVNDAFAAAHRNAPSMVAFQQLLPTAAGDLMKAELEALDRVMEHPEPPCVFVLGGAKISDAFGMMEQVLDSGRADRILTGGITGEIMLLARGLRLGEKTERFISDRGLNVFIGEAQRYLKKWPEKILSPLDLAFESGGRRCEMDVADLPAEEMFMDIGERTIGYYTKELSRAKTIFVNGPMGVYENDLFENGTKQIWEAIASSSAYSLVGGGDTVSAAQRFIDTADISYVCTAGGAMVRYLSGKELPLIKAMKTAMK